MEQHKISRYWQELYLEKESNPVDTRTDIKFCEDVGIHNSTLSQWKKDKREYIYTEVQARRKRYMNEARASAYKELVKKFGKDTNALKLFFQLAGDLVERSEQKIDYMTEADKLRRVKELAEKLKGKTKTWAGMESLPSGTEAHASDDTISTNQSGETPGKDTIDPRTI